MCQLVTLLCDPEFQKKVSFTKLTRKIVTKTYVLQDQLLERSLDCLKCCMKYYPSTCGQVKVLQICVAWLLPISSIDPFQVSIEKHLLSLVDSESLQPESSIQASWAYCMSLLPGLGGSGPQGLQYKTNWIQFCTQLIQSLHSSMSMLFKNIEEIKVKGNGKGSGTITQQYFTLRRTRYRPIRFWNWLICSTRIPWCCYTPKNTVSSIWVPLCHGFWSKAIHLPAKSSPASRFGM